MDAGSKGELCPKTQNLVLHYREAAQKLGRAMLARWSARLDADEFTSAVDLALCEAALRYRSCSQATFTTYLFYFIKGELLRTIRGSSAAQYDAANDDGENPDPLDAIGDPSVGPDGLAYLGELRTACRRAMEELTELERLVLLERDVHDTTMPAIAKMTGYSRGHLFVVQKRAAEKVRAALSPVFA